MITWYHKWRVKKLTELRAKLSLIGMGNSTEYTQLGSAIEMHQDIIRDRESAKATPAPPIQPKLTPRPSYELSLAEWRKNDNLLAAAKTVLTNHSFKSMLAVLENEHPGKVGLAIGALPHDRAALQSRAEGYQLCLNNLEAMGEKPKAKKEPEEKWQPFKP